MAANREDLVYEFIDRGFKTIINKVNLKYMGPFLYIFF